MLRDARSNRRQPSGRSTRAATAALCLLVHGCGSSADGGAVELSWKLRPSSSELSDKFVNCNSGKDGTGPIVEMRLEWDVDGVRDGTQWPCDNNYGVTGFDLPKGVALLSVVPICETGPASPDTYTSPAPAERTVNPGDTVSLGAVELVVVVSYCDSQPCICH
jgi:hypothetical protein